VRWFFDKAIRQLKKLRYRARFEVSQCPYPLVRLGSAHGGWVIADSGRLTGTTILSCGLGEDASFDVEFAARFDATVLIADPTPRAITHFEQLVSRIGLPADLPYGPSGSQPIESYPLNNVGRNQLLLIEKAIWKERKKLKFFLPVNSEYVSHSITNFSQGYREDTAAIEVDADTYEDFLRFAKVQCFPIVKLDIEGAEVEVIVQLLEQHRPHQILVEYDELSVPSKHAIERITVCHRSLLNAGYRLFHHEEPHNFSYLHKSVTQDCQ
jgi:FkbM family methyltransferase